MSIILVIILVIVVLVVYLYNGLVNFNNKVKNAWIDLEAQLKRRYDMIATLTETIKDTAEIEKLNTLRTKAMQATSLTEKAEAENALSEALNEAIAGSDKAEELKEIEDQIQTSRRFYNGTARDLNIKLLTVPNNFIADKLGFKKVELFATQSELTTAIQEVEPIPETVEPIQETQAPVQEPKVIPTPEPVEPIPEAPIAVEEPEVIQTPETVEAIPETPVAIEEPEVIQTPEPVEAIPETPVTIEEPEVIQPQETPVPVQEPEAIPPSEPTEPTQPQQ